MIRTTRSHCLARVYARRARAVQTQPEAALIECVAGQMVLLMRFLVLPGGAPTPLPTRSLGFFLGLLSPPTPPRLPIGSLKLFWERFPVRLKSTRRPPASPPPASYARPASLSPFLHD